MVEDDETNPIPLSQGICRTIALAVVKVVMSGTGIRCGKPLKHSTITRTALLPSVVVLVNVLWSIQKLAPMLSGGATGFKDVYL